MAVYKEKKHTKKHAAIILVYYNNNIIFQKQRSIPNNFPSSVMTDIPEGTFTSQSFPFSPFRATILSGVKKRGKSTNVIFWNRKT